MPDLLIELFCEEIPARMQRRAAEDLRTLVTDALVARGCLYEGAKAFSTPRRLTLHVAGLPASQPDLREEKKGPRVGAPEGAVQGFLKSAGLTDIAQATIQSDPKKGDFYVAVVEKRGGPTEAVVAEILPGIIRSFPWPKSMRWGKASGQPGALRWVRPLQSILCTFGPETEAPEVVPFDIDGLRSGDATRGHRFMAPDLILVRRFEDYEAALQKAFVILDADRRKEVILADARNLAFARGLELVEDEALVEEVAGLVEWPVVLVGSFDPAFLEIPPEVVRATIRANQKCFVLRDPATGALSNHFVLVSNIEAKDGGAKIVGGNERVVRARLSDARHFWLTDQRPLPDFPEPAGKPLDQRLAKLKALGIVFHEKLGTQGERVERITALAREIAEIIGKDLPVAERLQLVTNAGRAAELAKADLVTEMVGEFPEVQGLMGRRYAELQGENASVAAAIEEHYKPQGPGDRVPTDPVSVAVALADKLDTLVGFWAINEKPTGSKDPYALRRAALGVVRLVLENGTRFNMYSSILPQLRKTLRRGIGLWDYLDHGVTADTDYRRIQIGNLGPEVAFVFEGNFGLDWLKFFVEELARMRKEEGITPLDQFYVNCGEGYFKEIYRQNDDLKRFGPSEENFAGEVLQKLEKMREAKRFSQSGSAVLTLVPSVERYVREVASDLLSFFHDRLKVYLRDQGARHDLIDAVLAPPAVIPGAPQAREGDPGGLQDDLLMIVRRVEALARFLGTEDGANLVAATKRAANILRIEEKKDGRSWAEPLDLALLQAQGQPEEKVLAGLLDTAEAKARERVAAEDFEGAMAALAAVRQAVDAFFQEVTVNAENPALRANRLRLLSRLREATRTVADFSRIGG